MESFENNLPNLINFLGVLGFILSLIGFSKDKENRASYLIASIIFFMLTCGFLYYSNIELKNTIILNQKNCGKEIIKKDSIIRFNKNDYLLAYSNLEAKHKIKLKELSLKIKDSSEQVKNAMIAKIESKYNKSLDSLGLAYNIKKDSLIIVLNDNKRKKFEIDTLKQQNISLRKSFEVYKANIIDVEFAINTYSLEYYENRNMIKYINYNSRKVKYIEVQYNLSREIKSNDNIVVTIVNNYQNVILPYVLRKKEGKFWVKINKRELQSGKLRVNFFNGNEIINQNEITLI